MNTVKKALRPLRRAFTLIELLVVIGIIALLIGIAIPALKILSKGNGQIQSINFIRSYIANARSIAVSQHRQAGIVFFEETAANAPILHSGQTAMQLIVEDYNQTQYTTLASTNTAFVYYNKERQYLPSGIQVSTLNDDPTKQILTGDNTGGASRIILFNADGQMLLRNGIARPNNSGSSDGGYPKAYVDWDITTLGGSAFNGVSSPAVIVFDQNDYKNFLATGTPSDSAKATWIEQHSDIIVVNAYTGGILR